MLSFRGRPISNFSKEGHDCAGLEKTTFKLKFLDFNLTKLSFQGEFWIAHELRISNLTNLLRFDAEKPGEKCQKEKSGFRVPRLYKEGTSKWSVGRIKYLC